ncbi:MAG TPA: hypothetical protein PKE39_14590 [Ignavibacteria bacterium]|nr:hypothetical protein [Ignavibacteria bacterium]HMR00247.1 hypothetical protein [Ignavibacteria bacterium]
MKILLSLTLLLICLISFNSCGDDTVNNITTAPDFDIYLVKRDIQNSNYSTYTIKSSGTDLKLFNDSLAVSTYSYRNKILLSSRDYSVDKIYLADYNGRNMAEISLGQNNIFYYNLSPDARKIFFISEYWGYRLYVTNTDGTDMAQISEIPYNSFKNAKFSPNGKLIAYFEHSYHQFTAKLLISNTSGTYKKLIKDSINSRAGVVLDWSPDGSRIIYHDYGFNEQVGKICVVDTANSNITVLANGYFPAWSPSGSKICFVNFIGNNYELFLMDQDGSDITSISNIPGISPYNIKWSKEGMRILYRSIEGSNPAKLWMYDLNTNSNTLLADSVYDAVWQ